MLETLGWCLLAAAAAWALTLAWARAACRAHSSAVDDEIAHWRPQSARASILVNQLKRERAIWFSGCRQGREDMIAIMPLLVAAQQGLRDAEVPASAVSEGS